ncbi:HdeD family acid-resistance protein [Candidatus Binatus sp.]|uniref:HdeD family acid-resistance protein n=1 Tax=Candidatus Binatus sp. TaxID=2811406 RepID=UPI003C6503C6
MILTRLTHYWWTYVVRGILAIAFGMVAAGWPRLTVGALTIAFGAYALADGLFLFGCAIGEWRHVNDPWLMLLEGIIGVLIGAIVTIYAPALIGLGLPICVAAWSLAVGVFETATAILLRREAESELWLLTTGIAAIAFAVLLVFLMGFPAAEAFVLRWLIATYAIFFGVLLMGSGISLHELLMDLELGVIGD